MSCLYPLNLRGHRVVLGVFNARVGEELGIVFRLPSGLEVARASVDVKGARLEEGIETELVDCNSSL
jgi:hypothetical protein